jgi:DNA (cytosine-5)-methyltransferase 1
LKEIDFVFPIGENSKPKLKSIIDKKQPINGLALSDFEIERIKYHFDNVSEKNPRVKHDSSKYEPNTKKGKHGVYSFQKADGSLRFHVGDVAKTQIQEAFYCTTETYAPTIIANRVPKLWDLKRKLSVREATRLQGFPDKFTFPISDNQAYKQLGNSVSVPVLNAIIKELKSYL